MAVCSRITGAAGGYWATGAAHNSRDTRVQMRANTAFVLGLIEHNCLLLSHGVRVDGTGVGASGLC